MPFEKLGGRKFVFAIVALGFGTVVAITKGLDANYTALLLGLVGTFHLSNSVLTARAMNGAQQEEETAAIEVKDDGAATIAQKQLIEQIAQGVMNTNAILAQAAAANSNQRK